MKKQETIFIILVLALILAGAFRVFAEPRWTIQFGHRKAAKETAAYSNGINRAMAMLTGTTNNPKLKYGWEKWQKIGNPSVKTRLYRVSLRQTVTPLMMRNWTNWPTVRSNFVTLGRAASTNAKCSLSLRPDSHVEKWGWHRSQ